MRLTQEADYFLLVAIWGASFLVMQLALPEFGVLPTAASRVVIAALFLLPLVWMRGLGGQLRRHWKAVLLVGTFNSGIPFALYAMALTSLTTGLAAILNATAPLFGALVAWAWLKDRPGASRLAGLVLGFAGVVLLAGDKAGLRPGTDAATAGWAMLACLAACLCYGISASYTKRYLAGIPPLVTAGGSQVGAALALALPALWQWPQQMPGTRAWVAVVVAGLVCTGVAYFLYFRLIERSGPARALTVTFLIPVAAMGYGAVFLDEAITPWMVMCGGIIVMGTALATGLLSLPARRAPPDTP